jgi:gas vesicle protein
MEALGLIDAIIATICDSPRPVFSKKKVIIDEDRILEMLEKLKLVIQSGGNIARKSVTMKEELPTRPKKLAETNPQLFGAEGEALLRQAKEETEKMHLAADEYAKNVLTNLQVVVTKMMRNLENGKERLKKYQEDLK